MTIVRLAPDNLKAASAALARAFEDDPLQRYVFPDPVERAELSPAHFELVLKYGLLFGEVFATERCPSGTVVLLPPGSTDVTEERAAAAGLDQLPASIGESAANRFGSVLGYLEPFHNNDVPEPHWYVMVVGVEPAARGLGLGRQLLHPMLSRARDEGHPCYLETAQPDNVPFYEHLGFRVVRHVVEPESGLPLWTFRWDAA